MGVYNKYIKKIDIIKTCTHPNSLEIPFQTKISSKIWTKMDFSLWHCIFDKLSHAKSMSYCQSKWNKKLFLHGKHGAKKFQHNLWEPE